MTGWRTWSALVWLASGVAACGSLPVGGAAEPAGEPPVLIVPPPGGLAPPDVKADGPRAAAPAEGKHLGPLRERLYFAPLVGESPLPDVLVLRATGTQPVAVLRIQLRDDPDSPFGPGAAEHFAWRAVPADRTDISPGEELVIEVRYLADVFGMQSALLDIRTDAENLPLLRVHLIGKVIEL